MEAAGFVEACRRHDVNWFVFRGVSDFGDQFKDDRFHEFAARAAAAVMADFIEHGLDIAKPSVSQQSADAVARKLPFEPSSPQSLGPIGAPLLPPHYVPRSNDLLQLKARLVAKGDKLVAVTGPSGIGVQGMGGIGKTVLASAAVHDRDVQRAFPDKIYWITLGREPDLLALGNQLIHFITRKSSAITTRSAIRDALRDAIGNRRPLIVLDDVWHADHAYMFWDACPHARILITTRNTGVLIGIDVEERRVDLLSPADANLVLALWVGEKQPDRLPPEADQIVRECGYLPLALAAIGAMISLGSSWSDALTRLQRADLARIEQVFPGYPYPNLLRALAVSVDDLDDADRERYLDLAVFPEDEPIPQSALSAMWHIDLLATRDCMRRFASRSLATRVRIDEGEALLLHDLQRDMVNKWREETLPALHLRLVRAWDELPQLPNAYAWRWIPYHLVKAGRIGDLRRLLLDFDYLQLKLDKTDPNSLIADYSLAESDASLTSVQLALRLSAHVLANNPRQLASHLAARLLGSTDSGVRRLLSQAEKQQTVPCLQPLKRSLLAPDDISLHPLEDQADMVLSVAVNSDGRRAISASGRIMRVWDVEHGQLVHTLEGHLGTIGSLAVTPDGRRAISASDQTMGVWDIEHGRLAHILEGHLGMVNSVAITPDGRRAVSTSDDQTVRVWDIEHGQLVHTLEGHLSVVGPLAVVTDGSLVVSGSFDQTVHVWDIEHGCLKHTLKGHEGWVNSVAVTANGRRAVSASSDKTVRVWDIEHGRLVYTLEGHEGWVNSVAVTSDCRYVVSASRDQTVRVWDIERGRPVYMLADHVDVVRSVVITANGLHAVSIAYDKTVRVWDIDQHTAPITFTGDSAFISCVASVANIIVAGDATGQVHILKLIEKRSESSSQPTAPRLLT